MTLTQHGNALVASPKKAVTPVLKYGLSIHKQKFLCFLEVLRISGERGFNGLIFFEAFPPEIALHAGWFWTRADTLPKETYYVRAGIRVEYPERLYRELKTQIEACPEGTELMWLAMRLRFLFRKFSGFASDIIIPEEVMADLQQIKHFPERVWA